MLNANSSKTVKATDFKFDIQTYQGQYEHDPKNFFSKSGCGQGHMTPKNWVLNANSFKMVKATDFKFDRHFLMYKTDMTPKIFSKGGVVRVK